jgi:hypothetical protein
MHELKLAEEKVNADLEESGSKPSSDRKNAAELKAMLSKRCKVVQQFRYDSWQFFNEYKQLIVSLGLVFAAIVSVKLTLALLQCIE